MVKEMAFKKKSVLPYKELSINDNNDWRNYLRMDATTYNRLLELVTPHIKKDDTCMRKSYFTARKTFGNYKVPRYREKL